jgi:aspartyl-tRNA(Asn)/glutamyl-tRNA(Gln) amidotransferase subunit A
VLAAALDDCATAVRQPLLNALDTLGSAGFVLVQLDWPYADLAYAVSTTVMFAEAARVHLADFDANPEGFGADVRARLERGRSISATAYLAARALQDQLSALFSALFVEVDVIAGPVTGIVAPRLAEAEDPLVAPSLVRHTRLDNLTGRPAISLPVRTTGLPVGLHLTGPTDEGLLDAAAAVEDALSVSQTQ